MSTKIEEMQSALDVLKGLDVDKIKSALALIGEPVATAIGSNNEADFEVGKSYFIRTVTLYQVGRVVRVTDKFVHLEEASWIADTGRFMQALKSGEFNEVEPVGAWKVGLGAIVDYGEFTVKLPSKQK